MSEFQKAYDRSRVPLYIQVASVMRQRIETGQWSLGQQISTLEELESEFKVARVTVRQAIDMLRQEGLLHAQQGRGTFVAERKPDRHWLELGTTWTSLIDSVKHNKPQQIDLKEKASPPNLRPGDGELAPAYVFLHSVQYRGGEPYSIVNLHLARRVFDMKPVLFLQSAALAVLAELDGVEVTKAHQRLVIDSADPETANLLKIPLGAPIVRCHCVVVDASNSAVYVADIVYRADCIQLQIDLLGTVAPPPEVPGTLGRKRRTPLVTARRTSARPEKAVSSGTSSRD